jgi:phospholipid/cholesterol/gamma-HCH transport system substrate-binding protein
MRRQGRTPNLTAAVIAIVLIAITCYLVFGGGVPFGSSPFVLRAVFTANTQLHIPSPVRIAGVQVGEVTGVERIKGSPNAGIVVMQIDRSGLPIHADATAAIRSRIFLEGNFYVDLQPGTPQSPLLSSGGTLPAANTSGPVQLDRILSSLDTSARANLQKLVQGFGASLNVPGADGRTGAQGLNDALKYSADAFETSAIVNQALLGEQPGDLTGVVRGEAAIFRALASTGDQLPQLVDNFDATMSALADRQQDLSATIAALPAVLRAAIRTDSALQASFGPTQAFARALTPSIKQLGPTITVALPWLHALTRLTSQSELGDILKYLNPAISSTNAAVKSSINLITEADTLSKCFTRVLVPTGDEKITVDSSPPNGLDAYQQLLQSAVGLTSATQDFDGNGHYLRATVGGGDTPIQTEHLASVGTLYGNAVLPVLGTFPAFPASGQAPAVNSGVPCYTQTPPNLNRATEGTGP